MELERMKLTIDVYKDSGKWYTGHTVTHTENIDIWDERFKEFIRDNLPAKIGEGFVVVKDVDRVPHDGFHNCLLRYSELFA